MAANPVTGEAVKAAPGGFISAPLAVAACAAMAVFYVAILYAPTLIFRFPPPTSFDNFMIRRFACAFVASAASMLFTAALLGIWRFRDLSVVLSVYGIRKDHLWQAVVFPLLLTSLLYAGSLVLKSFLLMGAWREDRSNSSCGVRLRETAREFLHRASAMGRNVMAWRTYVVAPFTEELVFRACMTPLLLCGGFKTYNIIFFSPVFFSLAHLNHFLELYFQQNYGFSRAFLIVGMQLGYTVIFGWYASFLFIRTGNLISSIVAHVFCNIMGLPVLLSSRTKGLATIAFAAGVVIFFWLLFPASNPIIYNNRIDGCHCWHGYCDWT